MSQIHESNEFDPMTLSSAVPFAPEDRTVFRLAQLLILLDVAKNENRRVATLERLGYYDFFAANPYIVVTDNDGSDIDDRVGLELAGFSRRSLAYASTGPRFISRRRRLQHDLARLIAFKLCHLNQDGYRLTAEGHALISQLNTVYADAYRVSASIILQRLGRMSDRRLKQSVEEWLGKSWLLVDLLDDVTETVATGIEKS